MNAQTIQALKDNLSAGILTVRWWSPSRAGSEQDRDTTAGALRAERRRIKVRKDVIDTQHSAWRELVALRTSIRAWWEYETMPYVLPGQRLFHKDRRRLLWEEGARFDAALRRQGRGLESARPDLLAEARYALGEAFDAKLYPDDWSDLFRLDLHEVSIDPPAYLERDDLTAYRAQVELTMSGIRESAERFQEECFALLGDSLARLLSNTEDGNRIMTQNIDNIGRTIQRVAQMRFEGTAVFKQALSEAHDLIEGVTAERLRTDKPFREDTPSRLASILTRYQQLNAVSRAKGSLAKQTA